MKTPIRNSKRTRRSVRLRKRVRSGWYLWIDPVLGDVLSPAGHSKSPAKDGAICVRKIFFGVHRLKKKKVKPKKAYRGSNYRTYMETNWHKTKFVHGLPHCRLRSFLEGEEHR